MQYEWKCTECPYRVTVHRRLDDRDTPPTKEEAAAAGGPTIACDHQWVRVISTASVPFEHLRDKGVFERTHWLPDGRL